MKRRSTQPKVPPVDAGQPTPPKKPAKHPQPVTPEEEYWLTAWEGDVALQLTDLERRLEFDEEIPVTEGDIAQQLTDLRRKLEFIEEVRERKRHLTADERERMWQMKALAEAAKVLERRLTHAEAPAVVERPPPPPPATPKEDDWITAWEDNTALQLTDLLHQLQFDEEIPETEDEIAHQIADLQQQLEFVEQFRQAKRDQTAAQMALRKAEERVRMWRKKVTRLKQESLRFGGRRGTCSPVQPTELKLLIKLVRINIKNGVPRIHR